MDNWVMEDTTQKSFSVGCKINISWNLGVTCTNLKGIAGDKVPEIWELVQTLGQQQGGSTFWEVSSPFYFVSICCKTEKQRHI